jgi:retinol-binding protein 3
MSPRALTLCFTLTLASAPLSGQTTGAPGTRPAVAPVVAASRPPAVPSTPAGTALRAWLDAFNSGDSTQIAAYLRTYGPERAVGDAFFRQMTGGFDLLTIERSEPRHVEFTVRERKKPMTVYGALDLSAGEPPRVTDLMLEPLGLNASVAALRIDATTRVRVVNRAAALLDSFYVFPEAAKRMGDSVRARLARGAYDAYETGPGFAMRLGKELGEIAHDKHLRFDYSTDALPPQPPESAMPPKPSPDELAQMRREMDEMNCGFQKAEQLDGNVGYLKFDGFAPPEICGPTASAAMNFLAGTRALILDLRDNGGGTPRMVAFVASYLFDRRTHINDLWTRRTDSTQEFWTQDSVPGRRFGGEKPVYLLTSARTFSGAEEFAYDLKTLKRATIVGETTGGGAHPVRGRRIDDHFMIGVPFARAINPITHTDWEGVGVEPDVKVPASEALATAQKLLRDKMRQ